MAQYKIILQETVVSEFNIDADSPQDAAEQARRNYKAGIMTGEPGECQQAEICVLDAAGETKLDFEEI